MITKIKILEDDIFYHCLVTVSALIKCFAPTSLPFAVQ